MHSMHVTQAGVGVPKRAIPEKVALSHYRGFDFSRKKGVPVTK